MTEAERLLAENLLRQIVRRVPGLYPTTHPGQAVHHLNGDPFDWRPENIRIVDVRENRKR